MKKTFVTTCLFALIGMLPLLAQIQEPIKFRTELKKISDTEAELVFPMHMWQDYSAIAGYKGKISNIGMADRVMDIERENQVFLIAEN